MTKPNHAPLSLNDVLEHYVAEGPGYETMNDYVRRFPEYRDALSDFTVQWSAMEYAKSIEESSSEASGIEASLAAVRCLLSSGATTESAPNAEGSPLPRPADPLLAKSSCESPSAPLESLEDIMLRLTIDSSGLEDQSGLGYSILINLSTGSFSFESPAEEECVARELQRHIRSFVPDTVLTLSAVRQSITMPTTIAAGYSSSPNHKPEAVTKSFRQGIIDARDMTDDAKQAWLRILDEAC